MQSIEMLSLEGNIRVGYTMLALAVGEGEQRTTLSLPVYARSLAVPLDHPRYSDIRGTLARVAEQFRVTGICAAICLQDAETNKVLKPEDRIPMMEVPEINKAGWPHFAKPVDQERYIKAVNTWTTRIEIGYNTFDSAFRAELKKADISI